MVILGIDPALTKSGWAVIKVVGNKYNYLSSGVIVTNNKSTLPHRLSHIADIIAAVIAEWKPQKIAMEETFANKNPASSLKLANARGAIMSEIGRHDCEFFEYSPNKIKKTITGSGHADKDQIMHMIKIIFPNNQITSPDAADALATAYTCATMQQASSLLK